MIKIILHQAVNFSQTELRKLNQSILYLQDFVNSPSFEEKIIGHRYLGKFQFANNGGLTNQEIYNLIMSGKEVLRPKEDGIWDISLTIYNAYFRGRNVIGYTYPNTQMQWINRRFFNMFNYKGIAGNLAHEYCHKLGFDHDFNSTARRPYSIPYVVGDIVAAGKLDQKFYKHVA